MEGGKDLVPEVEVSLAVGMEEWQPKPAKLADSAHPIRVIGCHARLAPGIARLHNVEG